MIIGRIFTGLGVGINTTTVPMWQSETWALLPRYSIHVSIRDQLPPHMEPGKRDCNGGYLVWRLCDCVGDSCWYICKIHPITSDSDVNVRLGIESIRWKFYLVFAIVNLVWVPVCWYFYVETAGLSLEEVDKLFEIKYANGGSMTHREAAREAKEEMKARMDQEKYGKVSPDEKQNTTELEYVTDES